MLATGPRNLSLTWCSANRCGSLKWISIAMTGSWGMVYVGDVNVNEALVKNGLAWVGQRYCKISICSSWLALEAQARAAKTGLWSHPNPVAPWEYRRNQRTSLQPVSDQRPGEIIYHGNRSSMVFHHPSCKDYNCKDCVIRFGSRQKAMSAGFRPCGGCRPGGMEFK
jgi:micrococcal nuclease